MGANALAAQFEKAQERLSRFCEKLKVEAGALAVSLCNRDGQEIAHAGVDDASSAAVHTWLIQERAVLTIALVPGSDPPQAAMVDAARQLIERVFDEIKLPPARQRSWVPVKN